MYTVQYIEEGGYYIEDVFKLSIRLHWDDEDIFNGNILIEKGSTLLIKIGIDLYLSISTRHLMDILAIIEEVSKRAKHLCINKIDDIFRKYPNNMRVSFIGKNNLFIDYWWLTAVHITDTELAELFLMSL